MENQSSGLLDKVKNAASAILGGRRFTNAVILAGGSGTRVGAAQTKQMITLCGLPLIVHTLLAFEKSEYIDEIVVVAKKEEIECYDAFRTEYGLTKLTKVVPGGATRQQSAKNGFDAISEKADYAAIHDGARADYACADQRGCAFRLRARRGDCRFARDRYGEIRGGWAHCRNA